MGLETQQPNQLYTTFSNKEDIVAAFNRMGESSNNHVVSRRNSLEIAGSTRFMDLDPNVSVRDEFTRSDYETLRISEKVPTNKRDIMALCHDVYRKVGIVHNIIDLMGDFTCQGIRFVHPKPSVQTFYQNWGKKVGLTERSERFSNLLYRLGNVIVKRLTAKLRKPDIRKMKSVRGDVDIDRVLSLPIFDKNEIPLKYTFLSPMSVRIIGEEVSTFTGQKIYGLQLSERFLSEVRKLLQGSAVEKSLVENLPEDIKAGIINPSTLSRYGGSYLIPLDSDKIRSFHYKKDDNEVWGDPLHFSVLPDILHLQKMRLADLAALDGAISQVRLWTLGNLQERILPTEAAITKLRNALLNNVGGGSVDLIWGPELTFTESKTTVYEFLGEEKYRPVWQNIYGGLGVPQTLTGSGGAGGTTNNFISLQTLIQKLEYGRQILISFWQEELEIIARAAGFDQAATIQFDYDILSDKQAIRALLIQMWDRDIITNETILERFSEDFDIERARGKRERTMRKSGKLAPKASGFHKPQPEQELAKIALQNKMATPSEVGLELKENSSEDQKRYGKNMKNVDGGRGAVPDSKAKRVSGQGRPVNSKDSTKRKTKTFKPRTTAEVAEVFSWALDAQEKVAKIVNPIITGYFKKDNLRQLSIEESEHLEKMKFGVLLNLEPYQNVDKNIIGNILKDGNLFSEEASEYYNNLLKNKKDVTLAEQKRLQIETYIYQNFEQGDIENG